MSPNRKSQLQPTSIPSSVHTPQKGSPSRTGQKTGRKSKNSSQMLTPPKVSQNNTKSNDKGGNTPSLGQQTYNLRSAQSTDRLKQYSQFKPSMEQNKTPTQSKNLKTLGVKKQSQNKTLQVKTPIKKNNETRNSEDESPEIICHFATERINLPRGKVVKSSPMSSAYGSKRNSQSPVKLPRNMPPMQEPNYQGEKVDYFKEYWRLYLQNESLVSDIEHTAHSNYKMLKKIYNLEDYYEHNLIPQLLTYPHKFVHRLRQQQLLKQQQQQKLIQQQKQQQEILQQMKTKDGQQSGKQIHGQYLKGDQTQNEQSQLSSNGVAMSTTGIIKDKPNKRKKHLRRTAAEIEREFICPYTECGKFYGSEGSLNLHIKIKHNGGNKTEREKLARTLVQAYINGTINKELETLDLNLPPGALQKAVKKAGLSQQVSETDILRQISQYIAQQQVPLPNVYKMNTE